MKDLSNEQIVHVKSENIEYLQFRKLLKYQDKIEHAYTLRANEIDFKRENKSLEKQEDILKQSLHIEDSKIIRPFQTHTDEVKQIITGKEDLSDVDGLLTDKEKLSCVLVYADCTPLFLYDPIKNVIGNIHSGWRGTVGQIGRKAIEKMIKLYNCNPQDIICCIGPCIGKCCFEVEEDVKQQFESSFSKRVLDGNIKNGRVIDGVQKYNIDTTTINRRVLEQIGLKAEI